MNYLRLLYSSVGLHSAEEWFSNKPASASLEPVAGPAPKVAAAVGLGSSRASVVLTGSQEMLPPLVQGPLLSEPLFSLTAKETRLERN